MCLQYTIDKTTTDLNKKQANKIKQTKIMPALAWKHLSDWPVH